MDKSWWKYYPEGYDKEPIPQCTIYKMLCSNNQYHPKSIAINYYGRRFTYRQVLDQIDATARAYAAIGVKKGDVVVICTVNTPEVVYTLYALNRLGAVANMVDPPSCWVTIISPRPLRRSSPPTETASAESEPATWATSTRTDCCSTRDASAASI